MLISIFTLHDVRNRVLGRQDPLWFSFLPASRRSSAEANIPRDVRSESRYPSASWSVNGYIALIAYETSRFRVVDHYANELQITVEIFRRSGEEAGCRLRIYQFRIKALNLARENLRSLHGQIPGLWPVT
jgi:hypothetical protein